MNSSEPGGVSGNPNDMCGSIFTMDWASWYTYPVGLSAGAACALHAYVPVNVHQPIQTDLEQLFVSINSVPRCEVLIHSVARASGCIWIVSAGFGADATEGAEFALDAEDWNCDCDG